MCDASLHGCNCDIDSRFLNTKVASCALAKTPFLISSVMVLVCWYDRYEAVRER